MKKILLLIISFMFVTFNVTAANDLATEGQDNFDTLKAQYDRGLKITTINGTGTVTLYGYSSCDSTGCSYKYMNDSSDYKEVLKKVVKCSGGQQYITYQTTGGADGYKESNTANYTGEAYWSEDFAVSCTNTSSGSSTIPLTNSGNTGGSNDSSGSTGSTGGTSGGGYSSSTTTQNPNQGVETYYIILGVVGILTYSMISIIKKFNLFKNV